MLRLCLERCGGGGGGGGERAGNAVAPVAAGGWWCTDACASAARFICVSYVPLSKARSTARCSLDSCFSSSSRRGCALRASFDSGAVAVVNGGISKKMSRCPFPREPTSILSIVNYCTGYRYCTVPGTRVRPYCTLRYPSTCTFSPFYGGIQ